MGTRIKNLSKSFSKVSQLLRSHPNFEQATQRILEELGRALHCQWGTYWKASTDMRELSPFATWEESGFNALELNRDTKTRILSLSEGMAGHVLRSKKPVWTLNLNQDMCLPRSLDADKYGLTGGIWFALKTEDSVYAVIELLGHDVTPPAQELILGIESFGIHLGYLLKNRLSGSLQNTFLENSNQLMRESNGSGSMPKM